MPLKILISGATGFVGSNLVRRLTADNLEIHLLTRTNSNLWRIADIVDKTTNHTVNLLEKDRLNHIVSLIQPDYVFHLANAGLYGGVSVSDQDLAETNFIGLINLISALEKIDYKKFLGLHSFYLFFDKDNYLKIDFSYYPFPRIAKGIKYKNIAVDSIYDIAVNKVHTISMQARARDFIDVYFIVKEKGYSFEKLLMDAKAKFDWHIDPIQLGTQLIKATEIKDYPIMLKKIDHKEWQNFFVEEAKKLKKEIFK